MENESAIENWVDKFNPFAKKFTETQTASYTKSMSKAMMFIMESTPSIV